MLVWLVTRNNKCTMAVLTTKIMYWYTFCSQLKSAIMVIYLYVGLVNQISGPLIKLLVL